MFAATDSSIILDLAAPLAQAGKNPCALLYLRRKFNENSDQ
jgi:hypothetical protein